MTVLGRPREFDRDAALDAAMLVFWRKGFLATSMTDLCDAMGIRSPSLYAAFASKENLYVEAVRRYVATVRPRVWDRLEDGPTARDGIEKLLLAAAGVLPGGEHFPRGCMVTLAPTDDDDRGAIADTLRQARLDGLAVIRARLARAVAEGELPRSADVDRLGRFYLSVFQGMAIQARDGATPAELAAMADTAMQAWPGERPLMPKAGRARR